MGIRKVLKRYSLPLLLRMESLSSTSAFMAYALWSSGPTIQGAPTSWMLLTTPFVLFGIMRYQLLSDSFRISISNGLILERSTELPEQIFLKDNFLKIIILLWTLQILLIGFFTVLN